MRARQQEEARKRAIASKGLLKKATEEANVAKDLRLQAEDERDDYRGQVRAAAAENARLAESLDIARKTSAGPASSATVARPARHPP